MRWLIILIDGLNGDVSLDEACVVGSVQLVILLANKGHWSVYSKLDDGDGRCFYQLQLFKASVGLKKLLKSFKRNNDLLVFREVVHPIKYALVNRYIDVTVFDCDTVGAAAKQFDGNRAVAQ